MRNNIIYTVFTFFLIIQFSNAQGLYNHGAKIIVQSNSNLVLTGDYTNTSYTVNNGEIDLNGSIYIKGNFVNNASAGSIFINRNTNGEVIFNGSGNSNISGTCTDSILFEKVKVESASTLTVNHLTSILGDLTLVGTGNKLTVGTGNLFLLGQISGTDYLITAISTGYLVTNVQANTQKDFRLSNGTDSLFLAITCLNTPTQPIKVKINHNKTGFSDIMSDFWDIQGEINLNATLVFNMPKTLLTGEVGLMRFWNGTRYVIVPQDQTTIEDMGTFYKATVTGINQLHNED